METSVDSMHLFNEITKESMKQASLRGQEGWEFHDMVMQFNKELDTITFRSIFKKAKQNALSSIPPLGIVEQRAGIYNTYNWSDRLQDLWHPSPAVPASAPIEPKPKESL